MKNVRSACKLSLFALVLGGCLIGNLVSTAQDKKFDVRGLKYAFNRASAPAKNSKTIFVCFFGTTRQGYNSKHKIQNPVATNTVF